MVLGSPRQTSVATLTATQRTRCKTRLEPWCLQTCSQGPGANSSAVTKVTLLMQKVVVEVVAIEA